MADGMRAVWPVLQHETDGMILYLQQLSYS